MKICFPHEMQKRNIDTRIHQCSITSRIACLHHCRATLPFIYAPDSAGRRSGPRMENHGVTQASVPKMLVEAVANASIASSQLSLAASTVLASTELVGLPQLEASTRLTCLETAIYRAQKLAIKYEAEITNLQMVVTQFIEAIKAIQSAPHYVPQDVKLLAPSCTSLHDSAAEEHSLPAETPTDTCERLHTKQRNMTLGADSTATPTAIQATQSLRNADDMGKNRLSLRHVAHRPSYTGIATTDITSADIATASIVTPQLLASTPDAVAVAAGALNAHPHPDTKQADTAAHTDVTSTIPTTEQSLHAVKKDIIGFDMDLSETQLSEMTVAILIQSLAAQFNTHIFSARTKVPNSHHNTEWKSIYDAELVGKPLLPAITSAPHDGLLLKDIGMSAAVSMELLVPSSDNTNINSDTVNNNNDNKCSSDTAAPAQSSDAIVQAPIQGGYTSVPMTVEMPPPPPPPKTKRPLRKVTSQSDGAGETIISMAPSESLAGVREADAGHEDVKVDDSKGEHHATPSSAVQPHTAVASPGPKPNLFARLGESIRAMQVPPAERLPARYSARSFDIHLHFEAAQLATATYADLKRALTSQLCLEDKILLLEHVVSSAHPSCRNVLYRHNFLGLVADADILQNTLQELGFTEDSCVKVITSPDSSKTGITGEAVLAMPSELILECVFSDQQLDTMDVQTLSATLCRTLHKPIASISLGGKVIYASDRSAVEVPPSANVKHAGLRNTATLGIRLL